jgi:hypothetical protein
VIQIVPSCAVPPASRSTWLDARVAAPRCLAGFPNGTEGWVATSYRFTNHTTKLRSVDSSKVTVLDSRGRTVDCYWDDSAVMVRSDPGRTHTQSCGGAPNGRGGVYTLLYDDETVDSVDLR